MRRQLSNCRAVAKQSASGAAALDVCLALASSSSGLPTVQECPVLEKQIVSTSQQAVNTRDPRVGSEDLPRVAEHLSVGTHKCIGAGHSPGVLTTVWEDGSSQEPVVVLDSLPPAACPSITVTASGALALGGCDTVAYTAVVAAPLRAAVGPFRGWGTQSSVPLRRAAIQPVTPHLHHAYPLRPRLFLARISVI